MSRRSSVFVSFAEARRISRQLGFRTYDDWRSWSQQHRPRHLPARPDVVYKADGWQGYCDFLDLPDRRYDPKGSLHWNLEVEKEGHAILHDIFQRETNFGLELFRTSWNSRAGYLVRFANANGRYDDQWMPLLIRVRRQFSRFSHTRGYAMPLLLFQQGATHDAHRAFVLDGSKLDADTVTVSGRGRGKYAKYEVALSELAGCLRDQWQTYDRKPWAWFLDNLYTTRKRYVIFGQLLNQWLRSTGIGESGDVVFPPRSTMEKYNVSIGSRRLFFRVGGRTSSHTGLKGYMCDASTEEVDFFVLLVNSTEDEAVLDGYFLVPVSHPAARKRTWYPTWWDLAGNDPRCRKAQLAAENFCVDLRPCLNDAERLASLQKFSSIWSSI